MYSITKDSKHKSIIWHLYRRTWADGIFHSKVVLVKVRTADLPEGYTYNQKDTLKAFSSTCVTPLAFKMYANSLSKSKVKVFCRARIFIPQLMGFLRFSLRLWILVTVRKDDDPDKRRAQTMLAVCALLTVTNISLSVSAAYDIFKDRSSTLSKWFDRRVHYKRTRSIKAKAEEVCRWKTTFMKPKVLVAIQSRTLSES